MITGANAGIGLATAIGLARQGAIIVLVCRNAARGETALRAVDTVASTAPQLFIADLSSLASVRRLSRTLHEQLPRIDVLINNAGAAFAARGWSVDGIERTFATNYLGPFLLTTSVIDLVGQAFGGGRIINVVTGILGRPSAAFLENLQGEKRYTLFGAYQSSKLSTILFTYELARRTEGTSITANCVHPGPVATAFTKKAGGMLAIIGRVLRPMMKSPEAGARAVVYLASSPEVAGISGSHFVNGKPKRTVAITYDRATGEQLWRISERLVSGDRGALAIIPQAAQP